MKPKKIETDLLIIGSGAGGMTTAIFAKDNCINPLIIEKDQYYGGSTALSGGAIWIPNNHHMNNAGIGDSEEDAKTYLSFIVNGNASAKRQEYYLKYAPVMTQLMEQTTHVKFQYCKGYADYFQKFSGSHEIGRSLEPTPFNLKRLGKLAKIINPIIWMAPGDLRLTGGEYNKLNVMNSGWAGKRALIKILLRKLKDVLTFSKTVTLGQALIAQMRLSLLDREIPIMQGTCLKSLTTDADGKVTGAIVRMNNSEIEVTAHKGVVLAAGGFPRNPEMRKNFLPLPTSVDWTVAAIGNTGDAINAAKELNAGIDLMDDAWWGPVSILPDRTPFFHVGERSLPGAIIVDQKGNRFLNEAAPYTEFVHNVYKHNQGDNSAIPCYFVMDNRFRNKYPFGLMPAGMTGKKYLNSGYIIKAQSIKELAQKLNITPANLEKTVNRFNKMANEGKDTDYHKGENAYDRYYGDPSVKPNPCLFSLGKAPYYAVKLYPGDIGTKGGVMTDEFGRVLNTNSEVIQNLYAVGNTSASLMGNSYPGAGGTIGPAMVFGYLAALHISGQKI